MVHQLDLFNHVMPCRTPRAHAAGLGALRHDGRRGEHVLAVFACAACGWSTARTVASLTAARRGIVCQPCLQK